jgi:hypothetical protein
MKKYVFTVLLLILFILNSFTEDIYNRLQPYIPSIHVTDFNNSFEIINNKLILTEDFPDNETETYDINWEENGRFAYISFNYNGKLLGNNVQHGYKKYLIIYNKHEASLYDQNNKLIYQASSIKYTYFSEFVIQASSELIERDIKYSVGNCMNINELIPWVEGSSGNGIGESITFTPKYEIIFPHIILKISNGFVDYNRNYLYEYNNRVKKIRIHNVGKNEYKDIDLVDTPNYQVFNVEFNNKIEKITVEVLEIFPGEKHNDLCIDLLKPFVF